MNCLQGPLARVDQGAPLMIPKKGADNQFEIQGVGLRNFTAADGTQQDQYESVYGKFYSFNYLFLTI